jgi:hypothetical protein
VWGEQVPLGVWITHELLGEERGGVGAGEPPGDGVVEVGEVLAGGGLPLALAAAGGERVGEAADIGERPVPCVGDLGEGGGGRCLLEIVADERVADLEDAVVLAGEQQEHGGVDVGELHGLEEGVLDGGGHREASLDARVVLEDAAGRGAAEAVAEGADAIGVEAAAEPLGERRALVVEGLVEHEADVGRAGGEPLVVDGHLDAGLCLEEGVPGVVGGDDGHAVAGELLGDAEGREAQAAEAVREGHQGEPAARGGLDAGGRAGLAAGARLGGGREERGERVAIGALGHELLDRRALLCCRPGGGGRGVPELHDELPLP